MPLPGGDGALRRRLRQYAFATPANCGGCGVSCDDGDECTTDSCAGGACQHDKVVGPSGGCVAPTTTTTPPPCVPDCAGLCGGADDGCGGACNGACPATQVCQAGGRGCAAGRVPLTNGTCALQDPCDGGVGCTSIVEAVEGGGYCRNDSATGGCAATIDCPIGSFCGRKPPPPAPSNAWAPAKAVASPATAPEVASGAAVTSRLWVRFLLVGRRQERLGRGVVGREEPGLADLAEPTPVGLEGNRVLGQGLGRVRDRHRPVPHPDGDPRAGEAALPVEPAVAEADRAGGFEIALQKELASMVMPGDAVLDCGANVGAHACPLARRVGPDGLVIAVEPVPFLADRLEANRRLNGLDNLMVVRAAVSSAAGVRPFFAPAPDAWNQGAGSFHVNPTPEQSPISVEMTTIDALVRQFGLSAVRLLKLDLEGHEVDALLGAREVLRSLRPHVVFEYHPGVWSAAGRQLAEATRLLDEHDYRIRPLGPETADLRMIAAAPAEELQRHPAVAPPAPPAAPPTK